MSGLLALFWALSGAAQEAPAARDRSATVDVERLYRAACAACHGREGDGRGRAARLLGAPAPRNFTTGVFKFQSTTSGSVPRDEDLYRTIARGVPGTWMPAWERRLTPRERWALVRYIKGFSTLPEQGEPEAPLAIPAAVASSPELVREGRSVYVTLQCTKCHGLAGRGDGPSAAALQDDWDAPIRPADLTRGVFRGGSAPSDIYRTLITGVGGTPMPALDPAAMSFAGKSDALVPGAAERLSPADFRALQGYLAEQPSAAELERLTPDEVRGLVERRLWALVHYVGSLRRPKTLVDRLFRDTPELVPESIP